MQITERNYLKIMRNFLTDKVIVGATLCSRAGRLAEYCLNNLLKYCDKVLIVLDNPDEETKKLVENYANKHKEIEVIISPFPGTTPEEDEDIIKRRFKDLQGDIRDLVFKRLREMPNGGEQIDIVLFPDSDEKFSENLPVLLEKFWASNFKAIVMKAVDVFGGFDTIHREGMTGHVRILRYFPELTALPYRWRTNYMPLRREEKMGDDFTLIHMSLLTQESLNWKIQYWQASGEKMMEWPLWRTGKDVRHCTSEEIHNILKRPSDLTISDFMRGGDKRMPVGEENANKALRETSELLEKMGIRHWLAFGTCLNICRDGKIDKYTWDNDFIMDGADLNKFDSTLAIQAGFTEIKIKRDIPTFILNDKKSEKLCIRTICLKKYGVRNDVDIIYESKDGKSGLIPKGRVREQFVACHPIEWFKNDRWISLMGRNYLIPTNPEEYFESNYGTTWRIPQQCPTPWNIRPCRQNEYEINDELYTYNVKN